MMEYLTLQEVATMLKISVRQARRLAEDGMPTIRTGARQLRIPYLSLQTWLRERECQSGRTRTAIGTLPSLETGSAYTSAAARVRRKPRRKS